MKYSLFLVSFFLSTTLLCANNYPKSESKGDFVIEESETIISFHRDIRKGKVWIEEFVREKIRKNTATRQSYSKPIFFDETSEVKDLKYYYDYGDRARKLSAITKDYQQQGIFHNDVKLKIFSSAPLSNGEYFEYSYRKVYNDPKYFTSLYFGDIYDIYQKTVKIVQPGWAVIELLKFNFEGMEIKEETKELKDGQVQIFEVQDYAHLNRESGSPSHSKIDAHIIFVCQKFEGINNLDMVGSTEDLYKWYRTLTNKIGNSSEDISALVQDVLKDKKEDLEKVEAIYYWVQDNIRYIAFEDGIAGFKPEACQSVYQKRYGDCKGMANLTAQMLKNAGFDARLTWIGTRDIPYDYSVPSLAVDNHMICTIILDGKKYYLDPTEDYAAFNEYAYRIQGQQVMIEDGDSYILDKIPVYPAAHNKGYYKSSFKIDGENISGKGRMELHGESKTSFLQSYNNLKSDNKTDAVKSYLTNSDKDFQVSNIESSDLNNRNEIITFDFDLSIANSVTFLDDEYYLGLETEGNFKNFTFKEDRKLDYEFDRKIYNQLESTLAIPEGFSVSYLPEPIDIKENGYSFSGSYSEKDGKVIYKRTLIVEAEVLSVEQMEKWNSNIESLTEFYDNQIIIKRN